MTRPRASVIMLDKITQIRGVPSFMLKARMIRMMPEATRATPSKRLKSAAARSGFSNVTKPATMYNPPRMSQKRNLPQDFTWNAWMTSATPAAQRQRRDRAFYIFGDGGKLRHNRDAGKSGDRPHR